jgi:hypothetical protein
LAELVTKPTLEVATEDFEQAVVIFNRCRQRGIQGSNTDFLICAVSMRHRLAIFTTDDDFARYAKVVSITLHRVSR